MFHYQDQVSLNLASGSGGDGCFSFFAGRKNPRGGPDGGNGGAGGSLIFVSSPKINGFEHLKKIRKYKASSGGPGGRQLKKGKKGEDFILNLPIGTVVCNGKGEILKDFSTAKKEVFLKGGRGGCGNAFFKTSFDQAPRRVQKGEKGQTQKVILEYKPLVYIAIIGKVNTGKSSFFNLVTRAKSPVASYPYTTLVPYVGQFKHMSSTCFIMDIPGLEKEASKNIFKGLSFLRSIQRAEILFHFIDSISDDPLKDKKEIEEELKIFDQKYGEGYFKDLSCKKTFFILTKADKFKDKTQLNNLIKQFKLKKDQKIFTLSNTTKQGLKDILSAVKKERRQ